MARPASEEIPGRAEGFVPPTGMWNFTNYGKESPGPRRIQFLLKLIPAVVDASFWTEHCSPPLPALSDGAECLHLTPGQPGRGSELQQAVSDGSSYMVPVCTHGSQRREAGLILVCVL